MWLCKVDAGGVVCGYVKKDTGGVVCGYVKGMLAVGCVAMLIGHWRWDV